MSVCLCVYLSVCLSVCLSFCLSFCLSVCLSVSPSRLSVACLLVSFLLSRLAVVLGVPALLGSWVSPSRSGSSLSPSTDLQSEVPFF